MKIKYIGAELATSVFGLTFKQGEVIDVTDEKAAEKLRNNPQFEAVDQKDRPELKLPSKAK